MQRKIVQHGPSTLTISIPAPWAKQFNVRKGDDITVVQTPEGLLLSTTKMATYGKVALDLRGCNTILGRAISAAYKAGCEEVIVQYDKLGDLERIHANVNANYIGFEIVDESKTSVTIREISAPAEEEFRAVFRRLFHYMNSIADETLEAARAVDPQMHEKLVLRDVTVNKLSNYCRRAINKKGKGDRRHDAALYHCVEQMEKIADEYKDLNKDCHAHQPDGRLLAHLETVNSLLRSYEQLFFAFSWQAMDDYLKRANAALRDIDNGQQGRFLQWCLVRGIARGLHNLCGALMVINIAQRHAERVKAE